MEVAMTSKSNKSHKTPLVTSVSSTIKRTIHPNQVITPEEIVERKQDMLSVLDEALDIFKHNLKNGNVSMTTSMDLERLVKLTLLVSGEAESITGKPNGESEETTTQSIGLSASKVESILDLDDPEVKSMFDKLYKGYNESNDIDE